MDDFRLTQELLNIMDGLDTLPVCCRTNLLKMTAAWERDIIELRRSRDEWKRKAQAHGSR